eukprot:gb/GECG01011494.1/.p1 GENE.gb/GECG01011494.1/~~gb/GECG01011494.1/.p1  ORF type:complete len:244 (+),score=38.41 gb/GECG01011494.1/:1-732(+)
MSSNQQQGTQNESHGQKSSHEGKQHPLESAWTFWYDKKLTRQEYVEAKRQNPDFQYQDNLNKLGTFDTVEGFWRHYIYLQRPSAMENDMNMYLFREGHMPMWESYPLGGCWILKVKKSQGVLSKLWQDLLFGAIGEMFEEPGVVGVTVATRSKVDMISIWNNDNRNPQIRFNLGDKLRRILNLDSRTMIEYKFHSKSMADKSTFCNADQFVFADSNSNKNDAKKNKRRGKAKKGGEAQQENTA